MSFSKLWASSTMAAVLLLGISGTASSAFAAQQDSPKASAPAANTQDDSKLQSEIQKKLKGSRYSGVQTAVQGSVATLTGSVKVYQDKQDAEKKAQKVKGVSSVINDIQVAAGENTDQQIQDKLRKKLAYDRVGYGNAFNAITATVQNGVATMGGHALGPVAKESALGLAKNMPGVTNVVDQIQVDPLSPMDNETRERVARAVYGFPSLNRYAMDPAKPIRITVINGHVILSGVVDRQSDKDAAGIQANTVPGVFSVTNNLQVAGQPVER